MLRPALLILLGAVCGNAGATTCMEALEIERQREFQRMFKDSDVIALVGPQHTAGARVLEVWKGNPGRTVFFRNADEIRYPQLMFAVRPEPSGPLLATFPDYYSCALSQRDARYYLDEQYGAGYAPSSTRIESAYSAFSATWYAGLQFLALALLSAIVWWFAGGLMRPRAPTHLQAAALPMRAPWRSVR